ncbi:nuclear receptor subfamily 1 group I member 3 [Sarcophilus harrisii]|uniref:Nuclear receptor subfamily 1 group I member 3 n=2 Tax=Sarcophilus harrisii TaxID=9305 RepID=A0A7N4NY20_SARHA|nr:nuclear receptor subfamily 1 group I member 3 [Sarcophilus harrisii]XP_031793262.1 nuclear receptor subfamily 1 group I member 3 [Sarcophilus harrisii]
MASREDEVRSCAVCGDRATGYHFHALTCEGCKGFFRRTVKKGIGLTCPFEQCCEVNKNQRRHCPACRLQKCLDAGMRKDMVLSAEALAQRRARQAQKAQNAEQEPVQLSEKQEALVQVLLGAHARHIGTILFDQFVQFRPPAHLFIHNQPAPSLPPVLPLLIHLADISTFMVQQVIKFTKDLPHFRSLPIEDQISLLKGAALEICHIELNTTFCPHSHTFLCGPLRYTLQDAAHVGFQEQFLELMFRFHVTLRRLQLQEPEYALMAALALFSPDRPGVTQREQIDQLQEEMALTLQSYIRGQQARPQGRFLYAKMLGLLAELRSLNMEYGRQLQHIHELSAMMPLLQEIYS